MRRHGLLFALVLIAAVGVAGSAGPIARVSLDGSINPASRDYVLRGLNLAAQDDAPLFLLVLNTPGGLGESMRDIVEAELSSTVPVVVYVAPAGARAGSAGVFITLAADVAAMAPGTNIGAAHPVNLIGGSGDASGSDPTTEKVTNDAAAFARSIAEERGRNADWAEQAVVASSSISAAQALQDHVIDLIAPTEPALLEALDGYTLRDGTVLHTADVAVRDIRPTFREQWLGFLADPNVVYVLFIVGLLGLAFELFHPGIGFAVVIGGVCLLLAAYGLQLLPVNLTGLLLILFGFALIVLDAFTPTNGILTSGGIAALLMGSITLFDIADRRIGLSWATILSVVGVTAVLSIFVLSKAIGIQRRRPVTGRDALVGAEGTVRRSLSPQGTIFVRGEYWNATSADDDIQVGERVRIVSVERNLLHVQRSPGGTPHGGPKGDL